MPNEEKKPSSSISPLALIAGALVILAVTTFAFLQKKESQENPPTTQPAAAPQAANEKPEPAPDTQQTGSQSFPMPPFHENVEAVSLQPTLDPMTVAPAAQSAYLVAQQKPKLLAQLPCFCYCDKFGHGSLHDCYVSDHAESCDICIKEVLRADEMDKQGIPAKQIRDVIVAQFHPQDHTH